MKKDINILIKQAGDKAFEKLNKEELINHPFTRQPKKQEAKLSNVPRPN
jgi:sulfur relay (sulfurtransferase) DsrC/TusE family protein